MAQADTGKEEALARLHVRTVRQVLRRLLENAVAKENGDWTMDDFLYQHRPKISSTLIGDENERLLFPGFNKTTNVDNWPLCLFHFLIVNISASEFIPEEIKELVRQLQQNRRELYARIVDGISETYFAENEGHVRKLVNRIYDFIRDQEFKEALEHMDTHNGTDYIQEFKLNHETEKSFRKIVTVFTPEQDGLHDFLEQNVANLQACEHEQRDRVVSIRQDDHLRDLEEAVGQGHDLTQSHLPPRPDTSKYSATLPEEVIVEIQVGGCSTGQRRLISERIVSSINTTNVTDATDREIQNVYKNTFLSYGEILARRGCIQIVVRPRTVASLVQLFKDCVNGSLTKRLQPAQDLIRKVSGCEQYEQEAVLYKDNYDTIMDKLAAQLMKQLVVRDQPFKPKHAVVAETSDEGNVLLHIKDCSSEDLAAFKYAVRSGHLQPTLNFLETKVQSICPNIVLNGRIYPTDLICAGDLQTEESTSTASKRLCEVENSCKEGTTDTSFDLKSNGIIDQSSAPGKETSDNKNNEDSQPLDSIMVAHTESYPVDGPGYLLLLNFKKARHYDDEQPLKEFFRDMLGFEIDKAPENMTKLEFIRFLENLSTTLKAKYYCFICVITDGREEGILPDAGDVVRHGEIIKLCDNMKQFAGKPKIFIRTACRGSYGDIACISTSTNTNTEKDCGSVNENSLHPHSDIAELYASDSGSALEDDKHRGNFIQTCLGVFRRDYKTNDIFEMMSTVSREMQNNKEPVVRCSSTLARKLYLTYNKTSQHFITQNIGQQPMVSERKSMSPSFDTTSRLLACSTKDNSPILPTKWSLRSPKTGSRLPSNETCSIQ